MANLPRLWRTVRHLKSVQISDRLRRRLVRPRLEVEARPPPLRSPAGAWVLPARRAPSLLGPGCVRLLNAEHRIDTSSAWNDSRRDKLWLYNLHYLDDLNAAGAETRTAWQTALVARWIAENPPGAGDGWAPYPLAIRIVNLVKRLNGPGLNLPGLTTSLAQQVRWLAQSVEWHLLGNHLFANAKALVMAGLFFQGEEAEGWHKQGLAILAKELDEQILPDGGNFERSPMYHALMLEDLLDLMNTATRYPGLVPFAQQIRWKEAAGRMLRWLDLMSHPDGRIASFNDAATGIAPDNVELHRYARGLAVAPATVGDTGAVWLADSGYVRVGAGPAVVLLDVAPVGPDYLPGHAHADTLSFELSVHGARFIVNGGTSRYGLGRLREAERATRSHSTVEVAGRSSSETWHGFRVGRRARPLDVQVEPALDSTRVSAGHDGYRHLRGRPIHRRCWTIDQAGMTIEDSVRGGDHPAIARYILHPSIVVQRSDDKHFVLNHPEAGSICLDVLTGKAVLEEAWHASEFGLRQRTQAIAIALTAGDALVTVGWC